MGAMRKLWATRQHVGDLVKHDSKVAAYRYVTHWAGLWQSGDARFGHITVLVDERDGHGWKTHERINLDEWSKEGVKP